MYRYSVVYSNIPYYGEADLFRLFILQSDGLQLYTLIRVSRIVVMGAWCLFCYQCGKKFSQLCVAMNLLNGYFSYFDTVHLWRFYPYIGLYYSSVVILLWYVV